MKRHWNIKQTHQNLVAIICKALSVRAKQVLCCYWSLRIAVGSAVVWIRLEPKAQSRIDLSVAAEIDDADFRFGAVQFRQIVEAEQGCLLLRRKSEPEILDRHLMV